LERITCTVLSCRNPRQRIVSPSSSRHDRRNPKTTMPKFLLILRGDAQADYSKLTPADFEKILGEYQAWSGKLTAQGRLQLGHKLTDQGGMVLTPKAGKVTAKDGPYVESKEVVGGIYLIKADDYAHAARLCENHPNFRFGSIEIREVDFMGGPEN